MKERIKSLKKEDMAVVGVFLMGLLWLLIQHSFVGMYFDDFGNASLSYGYSVEGIYGTDFGAKEIIDWAHWIYNNWGGRILYAGLILIPMLKDGIRLYMICQAFVIVAILFVAYKLICKMLSVESDLKVAVLLFAGYGLLDFRIHNCGTYWASASILYVWPVLFVLLSCYLYKRLSAKITKGDNVSLWEYLLLTLNLFFATFSQEQVGGMMVVVFCLLCVLEHYKEIRKYMVLDIVTLSVVIISFAFLYFAPGNGVRMATNTGFAELSLVDKCLTNYQILVNVILAEEFRPINLFTVVAVVLMAILIQKHKKGTKWAKVLVGVTIIICFVTIVCCLFQIPISFSVKLGIYICFILNSAVVLFVYSMLFLRWELFTLTAGAYASVVCLLISPTIAHRSMIPYYFVLLLLFVAVFCDFYKQNENQVIKWVLVVATVVICMFGADNAYHILRGYQANAPIDSYNFAALKEGKVNEENQIILKKYVNRYHGPEMYNPNFNADYWMKKYFDLPMDVEFVWVKAKKRK